MQVPTGNLGVPCFPPLELLPLGAGVFSLRKSENRKKTLFTAPRSSRFPDARDTPGLNWWISGQAAVWASKKGPVKRRIWQPIFWGVAIIRQMAAETTKAGVIPGLFAVLG